MSKESDFLVLGSGLAGLLFALRAAEHGRVAVLTKKARADSNTSWAQGGIAAALAPDDSFDLHAADTLRVGCGLSRPDVVRLVVEQGPAIIASLEAIGCHFSRGGGEDSLAFGREGGHSRRRIVHTGDATGRSVEEALLAKVAANPNIEVHENHCAVDLIRRSRISPSADEGVIGAYVLDAATRKIIPYSAPVVVLATGGCGKVYRYTSNPDVATGDGIAMAWRAGCRVANLEFVQFHPTCLYHPEAEVLPHLRGGARGGGDL